MTAFPNIALELDSTARLLARKMAGAKLFVTGCTGFFGKWLLSSVMAANDYFHAELRVNCLSRSPKRIVDSFPSLWARDDIEFIEGDIRSFNAPFADVDYLIHGATPSTGQTQDMELQSVIVDGMKRVLDISARRVLFISSGAVYGPQPDGMKGLSEGVECRPCNVYGEAKLEAELLCVNSELDTVIVRPFAFIGPYLPLDAHFAAGNFFKDALHGRNIAINSDGTAIRSYMYPTDLCNWLFRALLLGENNDIFNVGSDEEVSILELAKLINDCRGKGGEVEIRRTTSPDSPRSRYVANIEKAMRVLNVTVEVGLRDAIQRTLKFYGHHQLDTTGRDRTKA